MLALLYEQNHNSGCHLHAGVPAQAGATFSAIPHPPGCPGSFLFGDVLFPPVPFADLFGFVFPASRC